jgi:hypothetical protein
MNKMTASPRSPLSASRNAAPGSGLHGHRLEDSLLRAAVAEALGTLVLVLAITATAVAASLARPVAGAPYGSLAVPAAGGLALTALAAALGPVSGAHLNPAVTLGLACNRRFPPTPPHSSPARSPRPRLPGRSTAGRPGPWPAWAPATRRPASVRPASWLLRLSLPSCWSW